MRSRRIGIGVLLVVLQGCHASGSDLDRRELCEIEGDDISLRSRPTLCELVEGADRVGVFTVDRMYSQLGQTQPGASLRTPITFIELLTEDIWLGPDTQEVTVRTLGGTARQKVNGSWKDVHVDWDVSLRKEERIVYFEAESSSSGSFGYPDIFEFTLFHDVGNGYASADLFVEDPISLDQFEELVTEIAEAPDGAPCPDRGLPTERDALPPVPDAGGADVGVDAD